MDRITLRDYRCFHGEQSARLAPLTLLVGENSTGKTSFMAMIRALWDIAYREVVPDFKEEPYDLGSFDEIVHHRGARGGRADTFQAGFHAALDNESNHGFSFDVTFERRGTTPVPSRRHVKSDGKSITLTSAGDAVDMVVATSKRSWRRRLEIGAASSTDSFRLMPVSILISLFHHLRTAGANDRPGGDRAASRRMPKEDFDAIQEFLYDTELSQYGRPLIPPFASAPVRSKPRRTYDPARPARDPEGDYVPMYLADVYLQNKRAWSRLKERLEDFGRGAGLFDEISIKPLGSRQSDPFHVQVRKFAPGGRLKGPHRNLIDVGYGVSQVLPVITELLRTDAPSTFLLQQPEVHLHPSAQAALGSLFCEVAGAKDRLLVVETHSDHLLNRIRMDVRDGVGPLQPEDVSILYFERGALEVSIHSLRLDQEGNVLGAPPSYGHFFMAETERSLRF